MLKTFNKLKTHHQVLFALFIAFALIAFWRGAWGLMDFYLLQHNYHMGSWILVLMGFMILVITHYITKEFV